LKDEPRQEAGEALAEVEVFTAPVCACHSVIN
jgi:hypothetical protein